MEENVVIKQLRDGSKQPQQFETPLYTIQRLINNEATQNTDR